MQSEKINVIDFATAIAVASRTLIFRDPLLGQIHRLIEERHELDPEDDRDCVAGRYGDLRPENARAILPPGKQTKRLTGSSL
jgi:hypothetical protein